MFILQAIRCARQAKRADGNLAVRLLKDRDNVYWTATVWTNSEATKRYMLSGAHKTVMPRLLDWCDEAAIVHWVQEGTDLPSWSDCAARMQQEGRRSKVRHPSDSHNAFKITPPAAGRRN
jgi:hypothetical protein